MKEKLVQYFQENKFQVLLVLGFALVTLGIVVFSLLAKSGTSEDKEDLTPTPTKKVEKTPTPTEEPEDPTPTVRKVIIPTRTPTPTTKPIATNTPTPSPIGPTGTPTPTLAPAP